MRSAGRVGAVILSFLVSIAGCSDDDVTFAPMDGGSDVADAPPDLSVDTRVDADAGRDMSVDVGEDADARPADVRLPDADAEADTCCADVVNDADADAAAGDADALDDASDATNDPAVDAEGGADAVSEEPPTCGSRCASGVCDMNGDCAPCVRDEECTGGRVCNAGTCGPRCGDGGVACTGNLVCCTDHCVDITRDPRHCGACTTTCTAAQFCGNASTPACRDNLLRNICNTKKATFLLDGLTDDDAASNTVKSAMMALCMPAPVLTSVSQSVSTAINTTSGQPLAGGGELLVATGGDSTQRLVRYLETSGTSTVYNATDGATTLEFKRRGGAPDGGDAVIRSVTLSTVGASHDFFLTYVARDPITGTFSLVIYGIDSPGTRAGAFHFANIMLPDMIGADVTTFTQAWYLYEWTMADGGAGPALGDTFTLIDSGI
jgi:Stigma-specific protein, Stig1